MIKHSHGRSTAAPEPTVEALKGIYVQRIGGRTHMIWNPNGDDAISRAAWLSITQDMARQSRRGGDA